MLFSILILGAAQAATPTQPAPKPAAPQAATTSVSDTEIRQFATVAIAITQAQQDTATPAEARNKKVAAAVQSSGIAPDRFKTIAQAMQTDPALKQRIQTAAMAQMQPPATGR